MNFWARIQNAFSSKDNHNLRKGMTYIPQWELSKHKFGEAMFINIAQLLTDLYAELTWRIADTPKAKAWRDYMDRNGQRLLLQLLRGKGYVVIGYNSVISETGTEWTFYEIPETQYKVVSNSERSYIVCNDQTQQFYVLKSPTYEQVGMSDHDICKGYIAMLDAVLNGATTTAERLGAYVVMSPKSDQFGGVLTEDEGKELEKSLADEYGMLSRQKQIMLLQRPMDAQVVSLAGVDTRMNDKARIAILAIADRLKVPANQIAIIDANSSKSLSNGSELREGDMSKYRSFRRLVDATLYDFAKEIGITADYTLENEPKSIQGQTIESNE